MHRGAIDFSPVPADKLSRGSFSTAAGNWASAADKSLVNV